MIAFAATITAAAFAQTKPTPATQPATGPITYYNDNCNRCHGQIDSAYPDSTKPPTGAALKKVIQEMAEGPAQAPLDEAGLAEQVKLHEALFGGGPYVWIDPTNRDRIQGETIPGTQIPHGTIHEEKFTLPSNSTRIDVERNGKRQSIETKR